MPERDEFILTDAELAGVAFVRDRYPRPDLEVGYAFVLKRTPIAPLLVDVYERPVITVSGEPEPGDRVAVWQVLRSGYAECIDSERVGLAEELLGSRWRSRKPMRVQGDGPAKVAVCEITRVEEGEDPAVSMKVVQGHGSRRGRIYAGRRVSELRREWEPVA